MVKARVVLFLKRFHAAIDFALFRLQRLQLSTAIVNDSDGGGESEFQRARAHNYGILRIVNASAHNGIDVHVKHGMLREKLQLLVENLKTLLRDVVGFDVINRNLQVIKSGIVQPVDAFSRQQIAIGDHSRNDSVSADAFNDQVELWM